MLFILLLQIQKTSLVSTLKILTFQFFPETERPRLVCVAEQWASRWHDLIRCPRPRCFHGSETGWSQVSLAELQWFRLLPVAVYFLADYSVRRVEAEAELLTQGRPLFLIIH